MKQNFKQRLKELKEKYHNTVFLFRSYEDRTYMIFGEDARKVVNILSLTMTIKDEMPTCSFPFERLDTYLPRLIRAGERIAIVEEISGK